jgi:hypothetical protein
MSSQSAVGRYAHVLEDMREDAARAMDELF